MNEVIEDGHDISDEDIALALAIPENSAYFEGGKLLSCIDCEAVFQSIVQRSATLSFVEIEGAYSCSKMRPGEFGGFGEIITADNLIYKSTTEFLREAHAELDEPSAIVRDSKREGNDFTMDADGPGAWIIVPGSEGVSVQAFQKGNEGENPYDSMNVIYSEIKANSEDEDEDEDSSPTQA